MKSLEFKFRKTQELKGAIERARGVLAVADSFFDVPLTEFIACRNGMLSLPEMRLHPFSPTFRRRNKLSVEYNPVAECPLFLETLLRPALNDDDIDLLQRWSGMVLTGTNLAQKLMFVTGVGGGGKGSLIRVLIGVIGNTNIASLRTKHLHERFELSRLFGKTLLYGADVDENFLNTPGASVLKSLTGGDPVTVEFKLSNETPGVVCRFNAVVTCNSLPQIRFEGDTSAWRRRLAIVRFGKQSAEPEITDLSEQILAKEGAGVLNWMLEGLRKLLAEGWRLKMTDDQRLVVDDLLGESDSAGAFVGGRLRADNDALLTVGGCYTAYVAFCAEREWREMSRKAFGNVIGALVSRQFGLTLRHDIEGADSTPQRGWKGVEVI